VLVVVVIDGTKSEQLAAFVDAPVYVLVYVPSGGVQPLAPPLLEPLLDPLLEPAPDPLLEPLPDPLLEPLPDPLLEPLPDPLLEPLPDPLLEPPPGDEGEDEQSAVPPARSPPATRTAANLPK
jgi:hypothetical protein